jgi:hypothetical protein
MTILGVALMRFVKTIFPHCGLNSAARLSSAITAKEACDTHTAQADYRHMTSGLD